MAQTPKQIAGQQRRSLRKIQQQLLGMSAAWGDVDQFNANILEELAGQVEDASDNLVDEAA